MVGTENGCESLKLVSKIGFEWFEQMVHGFPFGTFRPENRTTFSDVPLLPEIFLWNDPKSRVPFTFQPEFPPFSSPEPAWPSGPPARGHKDHPRAQTPAAKRARRLWGREGSYAAVISHGGGGGGGLSRIECLSRSRFSFFVSVRCQAFSHVTAQCHVVRISVSF